MSILLSTDRMFVNQKAKLIELSNEYAIRDEAGNDIGTIRQEGQSKLRKAMRLLTSVDQFLTHRLVVADSAGQTVLRLVRPAKFVKSRIEVEDGAGVPAGMIVQQNVVGKIRFAFVDPAGVTVGGINAENWRAWNFSITDVGGTEIGRITKKWAGMGKEMFTTADNYLFEIAPHVTGQLRLLSLACAAGVDLALKQDARGLS